MDQEAFGALGGVARNAQGMYESGKRPFDANYLLSLEGAGIDVGYIVTGRRKIDELSAEASELVGLFENMDDAGRSSLLHVARSLGGATPPEGSGRTGHTPKMAYSGSPEKP